MNINPWLLLLNALAWFAPVMRAQGIARNYIFVVAFLFSGSYWFGAAFNLYTGRVEGLTIENLVDQSLVYSVWAAICLHVGFYAAVRKDVRLNLVRFLPKVEFDIDLNPIVSNILLGVALSIAVYSFLMALTDIGAGDRVFFMDQVQSFWYIVLLPFNSILLTALVISDTRLLTGKSLIRDYLFWIIIGTHVVLTGFDGSRRPILIPLFATSIVILIRNFRTKGVLIIPNRNMFFLFFLFFVSSVFSINRNFDVGWGIIRLLIDFDFYQLEEFVPYIFQMLFAASPTIHVNTQMIELVTTEGMHGPGFYFSAIGNFIFPKLLFGQYLFGDPLVSVMHAELGWYGQDFGFMAEAIYAGGASAVLIMHFIYGCFIAFVLNHFRSERHGLFFVFLALTILLGLVNSLRSDFMNLLKITFYPAMGLYLVALGHKYYWSLMRSKRSTKSESSQQTAGS